MSDSSLAATARFRFFLAWMNYIIVKVITAATASIHIYGCGCLYIWHRPSVLPFPPGLRCLNKHSFNMVVLVIVPWVIPQGVMLRWMTWVSTLSNAILWPATELDRNPFLANMSHKNHMKTKKDGSKGIPACRVTVKRRRIKKHYTTTLFAGIRSL